ncbi:CU044_5270 family protein [Dactylosporangium sp. CA-139114]|uniref:CU044_5270 family protein n=1 Tax=Dactylosporangium sp. CA-139114 TaxID=3239931 RepID=UPI003D959B3A
MDEMTALREAFGPDPQTDPHTRDRARAALLRHMERAPEPAAVAAPAASRAWRRWPLRVALTAAAAAAAVIGVVAVENIGTVDDSGTGSSTTGLPFPRPASAAEVLTNAAWAATRKPWTDPRPDQFMYNESRELRNERAYEQQHPNDPIVPGHTRTITVQEWKRVDAKVMGTVEDGRLKVYEQGGQVTWGQLDYDQLKRLDTPDKVIAWDRAPKNFGIDLDRLIGQYVLPPRVEAAFYGALAKGEGVRLNPDAVNLDGRRAIGLGRVKEGYLAQELLFDPDTYRLIGEREVAIADHHNTDEHGDDDFTPAGALFRQVIYTQALIVDKVGDTR